MKITKIEIKNFKSIENIEFDLNKIGDSYTKIFVGINESGKSNILDAISYFNVPTKDCTFFDYCNQKLEDEEYVDLYYHLDFDGSLFYRTYINKKIESDKSFNFTISEIKKNVYLKDDSTNFQSDYEFTLELPKGDFYYKEVSKVTTESGKQITTKHLNIVDADKADESFVKLTESLFENFFNDNIIAIIKALEPNISFWTPSDEYLLADVNLESYKDDIESNKPLKNIFSLAGYKTQEEILSVINVLTNSRQRSKLVSKLNKTINAYISGVWNHNIDLIIDITESGAFSLLIRDKGEENVHDRFSINDRSQGAKQFLSLILSLSIESKNASRKNELILIDEPEVHLHPSGIRDLAVELLRIGEKNYVFTATHSPFLIDNKNKERHYIIKKNKKAITEVHKITKDENLLDDEVLREAFGIEIYKDLLNPHSIIVEGCSDKVILQKALSILSNQSIGITNGHGSNIDTLASKFNHNHISLLVLVDDDNEGRKYKKNILKIGGIYNVDNVKSIRDLSGDIVDKGTIEDTLDKDFVESQFKKFYKTQNGDDIEIIIDEQKPILEQLIITLKKNKKYNQWNMDLFKTQLSEQFNPTKNSLEKKNPKLSILVKNIIKVLVTE